MQTTLPYKFPTRAASYLSTLVKAIERTHQLLHEPCPVLDSEKLHSAKSALYAAIERAGMEVEQLSAVQKILRELLSLVMLQSDISWSERQEALQRLAELKSQI